MLVEKESSLSSPESMHLKECLESKNLEVAYLQQKIHQRNREIDRLQNELKDAQHSLFARVKQRVGNFLDRIVFKKTELTDDFPKRMVARYPEDVIVQASPL